MITERQNRKDNLDLNTLIQPKKEIADYVESKGLLVPKRFQNLDEALSSRKPFIIRSEHPQDTTGASGILESLVVTPEALAKVRKKFPSGIPDTNWNELSFNTYAEFSRSDVHDQILASVPDLPQEDIEKALVLLSRPETLQYCTLLGLSQIVFEKNVSFSYWEYIKGIRQIVVADDAISGRYHIFSDAEDITRGRYDYTVYEKGEIIMTGPSWTRPLGWPYDFDRAISLYESVRNLSAFTKENSAIMETVVNDDKRYFLQYHKGKEFNPAGFLLDRSLKKDEVEADFVRGSTQKEGLTCTSKFWYPDMAIGAKLMEEEASFDFHYNLIFSELMTRNRKAQFIVGENFNHLALKSIDMHLQKSKLFKPGVSIFLSEENVLKLLPEFSHAGKRISPEDLGVGDHSDFRARFHVTSDGRRAIVKRMPLDSD